MTAIRRATIRSAGTGHLRAAMVAALFLTVLFLSGCASSSSTSTAVSSGDPGNNQGEGQWGIEVQGIRVTANGHMLDFRYKVKDPEKARPLLAAGVKPYLVDQKSGMTLSVPDAPKVGGLRQKTKRPEAGRDYFIIFGNPGKLVKAGEKVTVVIGDARLENLVVE